jgi:hypothetical protein
MRHSDLHSQVGVKICISGIAWNDLRGTAFIYHHCSMTYECGTPPASLIGLLRILLQPHQNP